MAINIYYIASLSINMLRVMPIDNCEFISDSLVKLVADNFPNYWTFSGRMSGTGLSRYAMPLTSTGKELTLYLLYAMALCLLCTMYVGADIKVWSQASMSTFANCSICLSKNCVIRFSVRPVYLHFLQKYNIFAANRYFSAFLYNVHDLYAFIICSLHST